MRRTREQHQEDNFCIKAQLTQLLDCAVTMASGSKHAMDSEAACCHLIRDCTVKELHEL